MEERVQKLFQGLLQQPALQKPFGFWNKIWIVLIWQWPNSRNGFQSSRNGFQSFRHFRSIHIMGEISDIWYFSSFVTNGQLTNSDQYYIELSSVFNLSLFPNLLSSLHFPPRQIAAATAELVWRRPATTACTSRVHLKRPSRPGPERATSAEGQRDSSPSTAWFQGLYAVRDTFDWQIPEGAERVVASLIISGRRCPFSIQFLGRNSPNFGHTNIT